MALAPFAVLCGGKLRSDEEEEKRKKSGEKGRHMPWQTQWERTAEEKQVCDALEKVRAEVNAKSLTSGTYILLLLNLLDIYFIRSRHRVRFAQGPLRLPRPRWKEARANRRKHRSS